MKRIRRSVPAALLVLGMLGSLTACGASSDGGGQAREVKVAVGAGFYPITYADEDGKAAGYDVEVFREIDKRLPEYEFVYDVVDKETMNVGVQTGTYQIGINSMFQTAERLKTYAFPENNMGYTAVGCLYREGEEPITDFADIYNRKLRIHPNDPNGSIQNVLEDWVQAHPDMPLTMEVASGIDNNEGMDSVRAGEYDVFFQLLPVINLWPDEAKAGLAVSEPLAVVPTYPILNQSETELCDKIDQVLAELKEDGTLSKLSVETFGYDVFNL